MMAAKNPFYFNLSGPTQNGVLIRTILDTSDQRILYGNDHTQKWQMSIDSLSVTLAADTDVHIAVSTNMSGCQPFQVRDQVSLECGKRPVAVLPLKGKAGDKVSCISPGVKEWAGPPGSPGSSLELYFSDADTGKPVDLTAVHAVLIIKPAN